MVRKKSQIERTLEVKVTRKGDYNYEALKILGGSQILRRDLDLWTWSMYSNEYDTRRVWMYVYICFLSTPFSQIIGKIW